MATSNSLLSVVLAGLLVLGGAFLLLSPALSSHREEGAMTPIADRLEADTSNCEASEARQLDFWVGEWKLTWEKGRLFEAGEGTNVVRPVLGGCAILETFRYPEGAYYGSSVSTYNPNAGHWQQTWVDNYGGYLDFTGGPQADGSTILSREFEHEGQTIAQRMVFHNITEDSLDWNWERSMDGGRTWETLWAIHYDRQQPSQ